MSPPREPRGSLPAFPIVVPLDGSPFAEAALPMAIHLARNLGAPLDLVFVSEPVLPISVGEPFAIPFAIPVPPVSDPVPYLAAVEQRLAAVPGLVVHRHVLAGDAATEIARHATAGGARFLVLSTHGRGGLNRFVLGSVADRLAREAHCPLVLVRPGHELVREHPEGPRHLLVPLDGSAMAESIIDPALEILDGPSPILVLVHAVALPVPFPFADSPVNAEGIETNVEAMEQYLARVAHRYRERGLIVLTKVCIAGSVASGVLEVAEAYAADWIALTTAGRGGVPRAFFGSVADKVVRGADGMVILWNPPRQ